MKITPNNTKYGLLKENQFYNSKRFSNDKLGFKFIIEIR